MKDNKNVEIRVGDRVQLWAGRQGLVVCDFEKEQFDMSYPKSDWEHLKKGVLIKMDTGGLFYYPDTDEDFEVVQ